MLPGQTAQIKLASGATEEAVPASAPFAKEKNEAVLLKMRGDITAGSTKVAMYTMSVKAPLELWVEEGKAPGLWNLKQGKGQFLTRPFSDSGFGCERRRGRFGRSLYLSVAHKRFVFDLVAFQNSFRTSLGQ